MRPRGVLVRDLDRAPRVPTRNRTQGPQRTSKNDRKTHNNTKPIGVADPFRDQPVRVEDFDRAAIWTASEIAVASAKLDLCAAGRTEAIAKARALGGHDVPSELLCSSRSSHCSG